MIISDMQFWVGLGIGIIAFLGAFVLGCVFGQLSTKAELFGDTLAELGRRNREREGLSDEQIQGWLSKGEADDG